MALAARYARPAGGNSGNSAGFPGEVIEIAYHEANNPLVPTPRRVPELRNRRGEVTIR